MSRLWLGVLCGIVYGGLSAASMIPLSFPDKRAALIGAFLNRFAIGAVIGMAVGAPQVSNVPPWALGLVIGLLVSAADAVITKAYAPILVLGAIGGAVIGYVIGRWGA
ncbi:MAG TPA: hypothetical protein VF092_17255 [Longimicrobium sp.]